MNIIWNIVISGGYCDLADAAQLMLVCKESCAVVKEHLDLLVRNEIMLKSGFGSLISGLGLRPSVELLLELRSSCRRIMFLRRVFGDVVFGVHDFEACFMGFWGSGIMDEVLLCLYCVMKVWDAGSWLDVLHLVMRRCESEGHVRFCHIIHSKDYRDKVVLLCQNEIWKAIDSHNSEKLTEYVLLLDRLLEVDNKIEWLKGKRVFVGTRGGKYVVMPNGKRKYVLTKT